MKKVLVLLSLVGVICGNLSANGLRDFDFSKTRVDIAMGGGFDLETNEYPFVGALYGSFKEDHYASKYDHKNIAFCTVALVSPSLVMTSSKCAAEAKIYGKDLFISFSKNNIAKILSGELSQNNNNIRRIMIHPESSKTEFNRFNLSLIKLEKPQKNITPIKLPKFPLVVPNKKGIWISLGLLNDEDKTLPNRFQTANVEQKECSDKEGSLASLTCFEGIDGYARYKAGDDGSLFLGMTSKGFTLFGIAVASNKEKEMYTIPVSNDDNWVARYIKKDLFDAQNQ
ncbi:MAG: hypothetical protein COB02_05185 [Candidatus Cloacimonadota bacterium]|nr:MAG: hypothetical protein COB02_05185 [Candidatus Cloacimonadota bacterium]